MTPYQKFLAQKQKLAKGDGFTPKITNKFCKDFQGEIITTACENSRYANFAGCGLGKGYMQLEWADQISRRENKPVLIHTPLAVAGQFLEEGEKFGIEISRPNGKAKIHVANYEQIDNLDCSQYVGIALDEASILKSLDGKTKQKLIEVYQRTKYKFPNTATPSPNDPMELGNQSEFLNVLSRNEMLAMYFVHDGGETSKWRLKKHGIEPFYRWVNSWAFFIESPEDLGYDGSEYVLPPLNIEEIRIETENRSGGLFNDIAVSATKFNSELRATMKERMMKTAEIVDTKKDPVIIWVKQDGEADYLQELLPDAVEVRGSMKTEEKEEKLLGFAKGHFSQLITKGKIAQYGLNYQNCPNQIFPSLDYSYESFHQMIRRSWRFGQKKQVNGHLVVTDTMQNVLASIKKKQELWQEMISVIRKIRLAS